MTNRSESIALCQCGCGLPAPIASRTNRRAGHVEGQPVRFILGHHWRVRANKRYRTSKASGELEYVHRLRAERALGHPLPPGASVHHADGSLREDAPLVICQDEAYHHLLHRRMRVLRAGGDPNTEALCSRCHQPRPFSAFNFARGKASGLHNVCRDCSAAYMREYHARRRAQS
jgi:hypothetical protein